MERKQRLEKAKVVDEIRSKVDDAAAMVVTQYSGLTVEMLGKLRNELRKENVEYKVYKNTLFKLALKDTKLEGLSDKFTGPTGVAFSYNDPVITAKVMKKFMAEDEKEAFKIKGGMVEGSLLSKDQVMALADLPSREELLSQVVGCVQGPIRNLVQVMAAVPRSMLNVLNAIKEKKEKESAA